MRPYVLGGVQQPTCKNCHSDWLFAHFCKYESHGPVCPDEDIRRLQQQMIDWCARSSSLSAMQAPHALHAAVELGLSG